MNVAAFIEYLNKTKDLQIDASYYAKIEKWRQWWQGYVPSVHNIKITREDGEHKRRRASLRMPKRVCEDWANLLLNDKTTFQIGDAATAAYLLGSDEQQTGGLLRQLHFWENANKLVEKAYWSGTGAFVLSVEGIKGTDGQLEEDPDARIVLDYDPASCILPISVERGIVTEAAFVSECLIDGRPCAYLQTHTVRDGSRIITNEWFEIGQGQDGAPVFTPRKAPVGTVTELQPEGSPPCRAHRCKPDDWQAAGGPHGRNGLRICGDDRPRRCPSFSCRVAGTALSPRWCGGLQGQALPGF